MLIDIKDLLPGDEILVPSQNNLKFLKVIRPPKLRKTKGKKGDFSLCWCSCKIDEITFYKMWGGKTYTYKKKSFQCVPSEQHNTERYENLNYKTIWLIKRK